MNVLATNRQTGWIRKWERHDLGFVFTVTYISGLVRSVGHYPNCKQEMCALHAAASHSCGLPSPVNSDWHTCGHTHSVCAFVICVKCGCLICSRMFRKAYTVSMPDQPAEVTHCLRVGKRNASVPHFYPCIYIHSLTHSSPHGSHIKLLIFPRLTWKFVILMRHTFIVLLPFHSFRFFLSFSLTTVCLKLGLTQKKN